MMSSEKDRECGLRMFKEVYDLNFHDLPNCDENDIYMSHMIDNLFSKIWSRELMSIPARRLVLMGACAALGEAEVFKFHSETAVRKGELKIEEITEILLILTQYVGYPRMSRIRDALNLEVGNPSEENSPEKNSP